MRDVAIVGIGMTPVGEHWETGLRTLAAEAINAAMTDANINHADALYIGNAYGATYSSQSQLGVLIADHSGLQGIESYTIEAGDASGGAALRAGYLAVASGAVDTVIVVGVEKSTDSIGTARTKARAVSLDADFEAIHGATLTSLSALLMRRYMYEYGVELGAFEGFSINAHANGNKNPNAMYRNIVKQGSFAKASMVSDPVNLFDGAPDADGAAAVILTTSERAADISPYPILIVGSGAATDTLALQDREDLMYFKACDLSASKAYDQAGITTADIDVFELHDAYTIFSVLALEATGFAARGEGWKLAQNGGVNLGLSGSLPISTFGGLKSRGNPAGATGLYQAAEATMQLRGTAGANQVQNAKVASIQSIGGIASTAITHILRKPDA